MVKNAQKAGDFLSLHFLEQFVCLPQANNYLNEKLEGAAE